MYWNQRLSRVCKSYKESMVRVNVSVLYSDIVFKAVMFYFRTRDFLINFSCANPGLRVASVMTRGDPVYLWLTLCDSMDKGYRRGPSASVR